MPDVFWKNARKFSLSIPNWQNKYHVSKKIYFTSKNSTENLECSNDYHNARIRQKAKKGSLKVPQQRKKISAENLPMDTSNKVLWALSKTLYRKAECSRSEMVGKKWIFSKKKSVYPQQTVTINTWNAFENLDEKNLEKGREKLLIVQKSWKIFLDIFFPFFVPMDTKKANLTTLPNIS